VDVHGHYGRSTDQVCALTNRMMTGTPADVVRRARLGNIRCTFVSPLAGLMVRKPSDTARANEDACRKVPRQPGLLQWFILNPLCKETFEQGARMLRNPWCVGIKIHPEQHRYPIRKYGRKIFEFAEKHGAIVQSHTGQERSMPEDFLRLANDFPSVTVLISHMGFAYDNKIWHQVRAVQKSRHGNIFTDTSTMRTIFPGLIEWAVQEIGAERILFGTDSCLYDSPMYRARIDCADIPTAAKRKILRDNAVKLFPALRQMKNS
jgi:predicted TIM-barrel fold metal-dependent hydrolase